MKVLITGGAGFIGSHVAERLLVRRDKVLVFDNYATGRPENLKDDDNLLVASCNIADRTSVNNAFDEFQPEVVIHAAASYKDPNNWVEDVKTNALGTSHIVQASQRLGVRRLIYFQTALCYGLRPQQSPIPVDHPLYPENSSYAISKTAGEHYIRMSGLNYISFRLANIIGPRNLSGPVSAFYHRLSNNKLVVVKDTRRDFVFVHDLSKVVMMAVDGKGKSGIYHISSGRDYSIKEVFDAVVKAMGITLDQEVEVSPRSADDGLTILLDPSKTNQDFGWQTTTSVASAINAAIEWYKQHGLAQSYTHLKLTEFSR